MKSLIHPALIGWSAFSKSGSESLEVSDALPSSKLANSQLSEVSGTTAHTYGAHGALESTLDARGILRSRTLDVLDRVTQTSWMGDASLTVDQTWDDPLVDYSIGRLTAIARHGTSVDYEYDVFGRVTRDGDLTYVYDGNGNRVSVGYPGGTTATYGFDFADRHETLDVQVGVDPPRTVVSAAGYLPSGPLASLTLGNGTVETRDFDSRYYPDSIVVSGARTRTWNYQVDAVGNVTQIDDELACGTQDLVLSDQTVATTEVFESCADLTVGPDFHVAAPGDVTLRAAGSIGFENIVGVESGAVLRSESGADLGPPQLSSRTFAYQDYQYFLTLADGPWGAYDWTYDRIGNRLSEDDDGTLDSYDYEANAATTPAGTPPGRRCKPWTPCGNGEATSPCRSAGPTSRNARVRSERWEFHACTTEQCRPSTCWLSSRWRNNGRTRTHTGFAKPGRSKTPTAGAKWYWPRRMPQHGSRRGHRSLLRQHQPRLVVLPYSHGQENQGTHPKDPKPPASTPWIEDGRHATAAQPHPPRLGLPIPSSRRRAKLRTYRPLHLPAAVEMGA